MHPAGGNHHIASFATTKPANIRTAQAVCSSNSVETGPDVSASTEALFIGDGLCGQEQCRYQPKNSPNQHSDQTGSI